MIAINTQAQVVIKEKVEINPQQSITPDYAAPIYTPCGPWISSYDYYNPWQVVWNQISFAPDPYQQMFNFQDNRWGPGLQRRIYTLDPNNNYNLTIQQEEEYAYFTYGGFYDDITGVYVPMQYVGTALSGVPGSDIGATAWFNYVRDYPNGLYHNESKYRMRIKRDVPSGTEITMTVFNGQETINYHTRIEVPTFTIESSTDEDTLLHFYSRDIEFILNFQQSCQLDGYGGAYPEGIKFNVEIIQGQEYGNLYYPGTVAEPEQSGTSITNLEDQYGQGISIYSIKYKADGVQPDSLSPGIVTIRCSANDIDIAPVEVSFPVKYNEDPPDEGGYIIVGMDKQSYEPGDTAVIFNRWLTGYGEDIYFPVNQLFDVEITAGTEYGVLYDPYSGEVSGSLQNVLNGFRVLTSSSIAEDSVVIILKVRTRIGGGISTRMITNEKEELERRKIDKAEDKEPYNTESLIIGEEELEGYGNVLVKKDECDEEIVVCNNYQPPKFEDVGTITVLSENDPWQWIDKQGTLHTSSTGAACNYALPPGCGEVVFGQTYIMPSIGEPRVYNLLDDMKVTVCLDKNDPDNHYWNFSLDNFRVPLFSSHCPNQPQTCGYVDLGDGTNSSLLSQNITNCNDYNNVMSALFYWIIGPERMGMKPPYKYYFSAGITAHEKEHVEQIKKLLPLFWNGAGGFGRLKSKKIEKSDVNKCPEHALNKNEFDIRDNLKFDLENYFNALEKLMGYDKGGYSIAELDADELVRPIYDEIKKNIKNWASQQSWWCELRIIGLYGPQNYYDCTFDLCNP